MDEDLGPLLDHSASEVFFIAFLVLITAVAVLAIVALLKYIRSS